MTLKFEESFPLVYRACRDESIDIYHMKNEQYSCLAIRLNIFWILANDSKTNSNFEEKNPIRL